MGVTKLPQRFPTGMIFLFLLLAPAACNSRQRITGTRRLMSSKYHRTWGILRNQPSSPSPQRLHYYNGMLRGGSHPTHESQQVQAQPSQQHPQQQQAVYDVSICSVQGGRPYMEDEIFCNTQGTFCAVFDGHGGRSVSRYLRQNLYAHLQAALGSLAQKRRSRNVKSASSLLPQESVSKDDDDSPKSVAEELLSPSLPSTPSVLDYQEALKLALDKVDREVQRISHWSFQGSTAVTVWIHQSKPNQSFLQQKQQQTLVVANVGDSRAILGRRDGTSLDLTVDHKPNSSNERKRIEKTGGKVLWCGNVDKDGEPIPDAGCHRVNGNLALSRAIGDRSERPAVTSDPDIMTYKVQPNDDFVVLASDGLWDVMSSQDVVEFVKSKLIHHEQEEESQRKRIRSKMADMVVAEALKRGTTDNVSVVLLWLSRTDEH